MTKSWLSRRRDSEAPENIITDCARELGLAVADKVETDLIALFPSLTGVANYYTGTIIGTPTWGALAGMISIARYCSKSNSVPLVAVVHGFHWNVLARAANVAGASIAAVAPGFQEELTRSGYVGSFMGVPIYQIYNTPTGTITTATAWTYSAVFPRDAIALDWRRQPRVEGERNASMRGTEFNISAVYACGVWRPALGVYAKMFACQPSA